MEGQRVRGNEMCISSGTKKSIQRAEQRVEEGISLQSSRCVGCTLRVSYGKHGCGLVDSSGRNRAVEVTSGAKFGYGPISCFMFCPACAFQAISRPVAFGLW